jgi:hypothetical protein
LLDENPSTSVYRYLFEDALLVKTNGYDKKGISVMLFDCEVNRPALDG